MRNITLQALRDWDACSEGYDKIAKHVGENEVIDLDLALEVMSISDVVWVLTHDPDNYRWLSFLADMIDLPRWEIIAQAVRDYRDGRVTFEDFRKINPDAVYAFVTPATIHAAARTDYDAARAALTLAAYAAARAIHAANGANAAISIGGEPRLIKLIRRYYQ